MTTIASSLQAVNERIVKAAQAADRPLSDILLLAVSKAWPAKLVRQAYSAGQLAFGENYAQEALDKIRSLADLPLQWHFIGPIQSNKARIVAEHFAWVHSVDSAKIAEKLSGARPGNLPSLQVCLQVNISGEQSKSGVPPSETADLARLVQQLTKLKLRGLMAIPRPSLDIRLQRSQFKMLRELKERLCAEGIALDTLSMGMSQDLEAAIAEGATIVRVGTAIFGERQKT